jgi:hypothetical protein
MAMGRRRHSRTELRQDRGHDGLGDRMFVTEHEIGVRQCGVDLDIYEKRLWKRGGQPGPFFGHVGTGSCLSFSVWRAESSHDRGA